MKPMRCQMCHFVFNISEEEPGEKPKCPRCNSPDVKEILDRLSQLFDNLRCGTNKKTA